MRRWPLTTDHTDKPGGFDAPGFVHPSPEDLGESKAAFIVSGAQPYWLTASEPFYDPRPAGFQLVTFVEVPKGQTAFVRNLSVGPYCPPELADPFRGWDAHWQSFEQKTIGGEYQMRKSRATAQDSVYTTPQGWRSYVDNTPGSILDPRWRWFLTALPGQSLAAARIAAMGGFDRPFSTSDPLSWQLQPGIPVPYAAYPTGTVPGRGVAMIGANDTQVLSDDSLDLDLWVAGNQVLCLWTQWQQGTVSVRADSASGPTEVAENVYPLLPSYGRLSGFLQASDTPEAVANATCGV